MKEVGMKNGFTFIQDVFLLLVLLVLASCTSNRTPTLQLEAKLSLGLESEALTLNLGDTETLGLSIEGEHLSEAIELSVTGLPEGVRVNSPDLSVATSESSLLIFDASSFASTGESDITISASSGEASDSKTLTLRLTDTPQAELSNLLPVKLALTAQISSSSSGNVQFENSGDAPLTFSVSSEADWLSFSPATGETVPGQSQAVTITASCAAEIEIKVTTLSIETNDGNRSIPVSLSCTAEAPETGQLVLAISGLPGSAAATVSISGEGFSETLSESTTLTDLSPGAYSVSASDVTVGEKVYSPTPASQTVTVTEGGTQVTSVAYEAQAPTTGSLTISISGLPNDLRADISVSGPEGFSETLSASATFTDLSPGTYTVEAKEVGSDTSYTPNPESHTLSINSGESSNADVSYTEKEPGKATLSVTIEGLREGVDANIKLTKPDGFSTTITQNASYNVEPGTYLLEALPTQPDSATFEAMPKNLSLELSENTTTVAVFSYECTQVLPPDPALDEIFQDETDKATYNCDDLAELKFAGRSNVGLRNLDGIQYALNLEVLEIYGNEVSDISYIANLTKLKELYLDGNNISDISAVAKLTNLVEIDLYENPLSDISPLENLINLKSLELQNLNLIDISPLGDLTNLSSLTLSENELTDISPLKNLTKLTYLNLRENEISDIMPLKDMSRLGQLFLRKNRISDIMPLVGLTNLRTLDLTENKISDISALQNMVNLSTLRLDDNFISSIAPLVKNSGLGKNDSFFKDRLTLDENCISTTIVPTKGYLEDLGSRDFEYFTYEANPKTDCPPSSPMSFHYSFDDDAEGWRVSNFSGNHEITHHSSGGISGAYISMPDSAETGRWYWQTPGYFTGDATAYYGARLRFFLKMRTPLTGEPEPFVIWEGDGSTLLIKLRAVATKNGWALYQVRLSEDAGWLRGLTGTKAASKEDMLAVLGDLAGLVISSESDGRASALDEVKLEPIP